MLPSRTSQRGCCAAASSSQHRTAQPQQWNPQRNRVPSVSKYARQSCKCNSSSSSDKSAGSSDYEGEAPTTSRGQCRRQLLAGCAAGATLATIAGQRSLAFVGLLTQEETQTIEIFKRNTPSVVNVTNLAVKQDAFTLDMTEAPQGAGSGVVWDDKGRIVTNFHVIKGASVVQITLLGGAQCATTVVGSDMDKDIAVLQIVPSEIKDVQEDLVPISRSAESDIQVGQKVFAIGNPFGLDHTLTTGIVSGTGREIVTAPSGRPIQGVIQTDAAINPGNSGGPLLDSSGQVIGINTAIYSPTGANAGVGFAIPIEIVSSSVEQIIKYGKVTRPLLGITFAPDQSVQTLGVSGILVLSAKPGGPAAKAGVTGTRRDKFGRLVLGDIITQVNGTKVKTSSDLFRALDKCRVGDEVDLLLLRTEAEEHVKITLDAMDQI